jgi:hypothetical protein
VVLVRDAVPAQHVASRPRDVEGLAAVVALQNGNLENRKTLKTEKKIVASGGGGGGRRPKKIVGADVAYRK